MLQGRMEDLVKTEICDVMNEEQLLEECDKKGSQEREDSLKTFREKFASRRLKWHSNLHSRA